MDAKFTLASLYAEGRGNAKDMVQAQKWFALAFTGQDGDIDLDAHANSPGGDPHGPEFVDWKWVTAREMLALIVPFKRAVYEAVLEEFEDLVAA